MCVGGGGGEGGRGGISEYVPPAHRLYGDSEICLNVGRCFLELKVKCIDPDQTAS